MKMLDLIDTVEFTHHREIENGQFLISGQDITANLPYNEKVHLAFNYYAPGTIQRKQIIDYSAASTARVIYNLLSWTKRITWISGRPSASCGQGNFGSISY